MDARGAPPLKQVRLEFGPAGIRAHGDVLRQNCVNRFIRGQQRRDAPSLSRHLRRIPFFFVIFFFVWERGSTFVSREILHMLDQPVHVRIAAVILLDARSKIGLD